MKQGLSKEEIVQIVKSKGYFSVNIYKHTHANLRQKVRRLCRDGILRVERIARGQMDVVLKDSPPWD